MSNTAIFWPLIVQTALIYVVYVLMSNRRRGAVKSGTVEASSYRVPIVEPEPSATVVRNLENQFELPLLFYVVSVILYIVNGVNDVVIVLAWLFVLSRIAHCWVHITSNEIRYRSPIFAIGFAINALLWLWLAWKLI